MVDEPDHRREIDDALQRRVRRHAVAPSRAPPRPRSTSSGSALGAPRLPYVELDERELGVIRSMLERHGLLQPAGRE